ncbi:serine hydrolase [Nonomuraea angiospora]|uniref:Beta-lactamase-related domain-containing protein n=1 Tax=Nonomuraea angiospora TaxID=46172 RepID=A0ABR9MLM4_9ACTN|nr:serine hydrolase [Nonomuraea angiospora]MBE1593337.1 hypothetical protein [Nonomuraea angiospora]
MSQDALFDVAGLTEIITVWSVIGLLWDQERLTLADPLGTLMPDLNGYQLAPVTVHQLLPHTAGVPLPATLIGQAAPAECDLESGERLRGVAHDYSARLLGGVCGIAGAFSILGDVETFLQHLIADSGAAEAGFGSKARASSSTTGSPEPRCG